jgi:DNA-directed RNA polymerase specialized sigma24 family protein
MTPPNAAFEIAPLTKKAENGNVYVRRREVLEQLEVLVRLTPAELETRVRVLKESEEGSVKSENLVFLLRKFHGTALSDVIWNTISSRIGSIVGRNFRNIRKENPHRAEEFLQEILTRVIFKILDFEKDDGQYAQVSFGEFVAGYDSNAFRKYIKEKKRSNSVVSIDGDQDADDDSNSGTIDLSDEEFDPVDKMYRDSLLALLPDEIKEACVLRMHGWQISSKDPNEPTIAKKMGKSEKTIRNWFKKAAEIIRRHDPTIA